MASTGWDWVFHALGWALAGLGLLLALWALFWDRSRGRKRCPKCWYSMEGAVETKDEGYVCPECGRTLATPRALLRTRRRRKWAAFALFMIVVAWPLASYPKASRTGWLSFLPTRIVIELVPIGGIDGPFGRDLERRLGFAPDKLGNRDVSISPDEEVFLARRIARGNILARPIGARWRDSFGEIRRRDHGWVFLFDSDNFPVTFRDGTPANEERHEALVEMMAIPAVTHARTRDRWPRGIPVLIDTKPENWWPSGVRDRSNLDWKTRDGEQAGNVEGYRWNCTLDPFEQSEVELELTVTHLLRFWESDYDDIAVRDTSHHTLSWKTVGSIDDAMTPVRSAAIDPHLEQTLTATYDRMVILHPDALDPSIVGGLSFGVRVEIWLDDTLLGWFKARWIGSTFEITANGTDWQIEGGWRNADAYVAQHKNDGEWTLRLKTDPVWALYNLDADKYWDGEVTIPLTID